MNPQSASGTASRRRRESATWNSTASDAIPHRPPSATSGSGRGISADRAASAMTSIQPPFDKAAYRTSWGRNDILTGRTMVVLEPLARELGARTVAADLFRPDNVESPFKQSPTTSTFLMPTPGCRRASTYLISPGQTPARDRGQPVGTEGDRNCTGGGHEGAQDRSHRVRRIGVGPDLASPHAVLDSAIKFGLRGLMFRTSPGSACVGRPGVEPG